MNEYRILEMTSELGGVERFKIIGEGFMSFNAAWLAITANISHRLMDGKINLVLRIDRMEGQVGIVVGQLKMDDRSGHEILNSSTHFK
jgi:hypothetical protein